MKAVRGGPPSPGEIWFTSIFSLSDPPVKTGGRGERQHRSGAFIAEAFRRASGRQNYSVGLPPRLAACRRTEPQSATHFRCTEPTFLKQSRLSYNGCGARKFQAPMNMTVARGTSPEEEELAARRAELTWLRDELATQELGLTNQKAAIAAFEERYLRELGSLNARLAEWKLRLASRPAAEYGDWAGSPPSGSRPQVVPGFDPRSQEVAAEEESVLHSHEVKTLFREAAKLVHPDTATSEKERAARDRSMKEVNAAYLAGDEVTLRRIVLESQFSPDSVEGDGIGADLIRVLRQIRQVRTRISAIEHETVELSRSELGLLKTKADLAAKDGRDLLAEMAVGVQGQLDGMRRRYGRPPKQGG